MELWLIDLYDQESDVLRKPRSLVRLAKMREEYEMTEDVDERWKQISLDLSC